MILADKITALRKKAGWSQEELAEQLGVTRQSVSKWEGAQSVPDMDKVVQMSRLFGVTTDFLLKDELSEEEDYTRENKAKSPVIGAVSGIYWLLVTAVYLFYTFGPMGNGQPKYSWFIWAVGGVLYGALMAGLSIYRKNADKICRRRDELFGGTFMLVWKLNKRRSAPCQWKYIRSARRGCRFLPAFLRG